MNTTVCSTSKPCVKRVGCECSKNDDAIIFIFCFILVAAVMIGSIMVMGKHKKNKQKTRIIPI
jgi:hypothetical protein